MSKYDDQYYFIEKPQEESLPSLTPDANTEVRHFRFERQPVGSPPLVFINGAAEYNRKRGLKSIGIPPGILFEGADLVVRSSIREALLQYDVPNLHMHPAIYIHDDGKWYEDYWFLAFTAAFDCWDRSASVYDKENPPVQLGGLELERVYTYSLNERLLDEAPLEQRLLFKMGGTLDGYIVCHETLAKHFRAGEATGAKLTLVSEY